MRKVNCFQRAEMPGSLPTVANCKKSRRYENATGTTTGTQRQRTHSPVGPARTLNNRAPLPANWRWAAQWRGSITTLTAGLDVSARLRAGPAPALSMIAKASALLRRRDTEHQLEEVSERPDRPIPRDNSGSVARLQSDRERPFGVS